MSSKMIQQKLASAQQKYYTYTAILPNMAAFSPDYQLKAAGYKKKLADTSDEIKRLKNLLSQQEQGKNPNGEKVYAPGKHPNDYKFYNTAMVGGTEVIVAGTEVTLNGKKTIVGGKKVRIGAKKVITEKWR